MPLDTKTILPGDRLDHPTTTGSYMRHGRIYASVVVVGNNRTILSRVLGVGDVVVARVLRLTLQAAVVQVVAGTTQPQPGEIRNEDVGLHHPIQDAFAPNDLVLARVVAHSSRRYLLSTAEPHLGVLQQQTTTSDSKKKVALPPPR